MSLGLIGGCCGPCVGDPPDALADDWVYPISGLTANEAEGKFTIVLGRRQFHDPAGGPPPPSYGVGPILIGYSVGYYNECGCPHMIGRVSGTVAWASGDTSDKVVEIPLLAHGPPMFWTCAGVAGGGEAASFDLAYISQNVWLPNGGHYDIVAVCNHAAQNGNGQSYVASPTFSYHRGVAHVGNGFKLIQSNFQGYGRYKEEAFKIDNTLENYKREAVMTAMGAILSDVRRGSYEFVQRWWVPWMGWAYSPITTDTETVREWTDYAGRRFRIILSDPLPIDAQATAEANLTLARALVGTLPDLGGGFATAGKTTVEGGRVENPPPLLRGELDWQWEPPEALACPFQFQLINEVVWTGFGFIGGSSYGPRFRNYFRLACRYGPVWQHPFAPPPVPGAPLDMVMINAIKVDARGCLLNSSQPLRIELHVTTHQFTNPEQTEWVDESNTGWFDITDTEYWVEPPPFFGFKSIAWRSVGPSPPPLAYYCHPGYVP